LPGSALEKHDFWPGLSLVLLGALGFSTKAILIKLAYAHGQNVDAISLMALRMLFSLPFFVFVAVWDSKKSSASPLSLRHWFSVFLLGLLGYYVSSYLDFAGLQFISAGLERVILFLFPTFVVLFTAIAQKRWLGIRTSWALVLSYSGLVLVFIDQLSVWAADIWLGSGLVLGAAIVFAFFTMGSGMMTHRIGSNRFTAYTMTVASAATLIHFAVQHGWDLDNLPPDVYGLAAMMALFSTVLPAFFMNAGIRRIGAGRAAIISTIGPIGTLILAFFILHEAITPKQLAGTALVLLGVYVVGRKK